MNNTALRAKEVTGKGQGKLAERAELHAQNMKLRAEVKRLERQLEDQAKAVCIIPRPLIPAVYGPEVISQLESMADQGATLPECCAAWDISLEEFETWCSTTPALKVAADRSRTRARAVFEARFRLALMNGDRAFPFAKWVEIMDQRYGVDDPESKGNAGAAVAITVGRCEVCRDVVL